MRTYSLQPERLPIKTQLLIADVRCSVHTNASVVIHSLEKWRLGADRIHADLEIMVMVDPGLEPGSAPPQFHGLHEFVFATFFGTDTFVFDLLHRRMCAVISEKTAADIKFWNTVLVPILLGVMGPTVGVAPLHSACLASGERGFLIAGLSGAGKSTLALALAKQGLQLISDDWTYASENGGEVRLYGLRAPIKLLPDSEFYFHELKQERLQTSLNGELAFEIDAARIAGLSVSDKCAPECIFFLERTMGESVIAPLHRSVARHFFERSAEPLPAALAPAADQRSRIISAVTERDCWLFRYSGAPEKGAAMLQHFFKEKYDVDSQRPPASGSTRSPAPLCIDPLQRPR